MKCQNKLYLTGISSSAYKAEGRIEMEELIKQIERAFQAIEKGRFKKRDGVLAEQIFLRERVRNVMT